jgi:hypothetical protein
MANPFEAFFREFVNAFGGELPKETNVGKTADFVFRQYNVIAELKILETDARIEHARKLRELTNGWMKRRLIRIYGTPVISLRELSPPLQREWLEVLQRPVENIVRDVNRQIRSTKVSAQLPDAKGIALIANDGNFLHTSPPDYLTLIARVLQKKSPDGTARFPNIDGVIYFSHRIPAHGQPYPFWAPAHLSLDPKLREFQDALREGWFAYLQKVTGRQVSVVTRQIEDEAAK